MALEVYASKEYYSGEHCTAIIPDDQLETKLKKASRHIDALTYNRIVGKGFSELTEFQQEAVKEVCCSLADFEYEYQDYIENVLQSYGINGVSMSFGTGWNTKVQNGVAIRADLYQRLCQTGLCGPRLGVY